MPLYNPPSAGGGLPTGWTQDESDPANVSTNGGFIDTGGGPLALQNGSLEGTGGLVNLADQSQVAIAMTSEASLTLADTGNVTLLAGSAAGDTLRLGTYNENDAIRIVDFDGAGTIRIGFFGDSPAARPNLPATGSLTAQDIATALVALGLCTQTP